MDMFCGVLIGVPTCMALYLYFGIGVWSRSFLKPKQGLLIKGDPDAMARRFIDSFNPWARWRSQWKWVLLRVNNDRRYIMHYRAGGWQEDFSKVLKNQYVALRIGSGDVYFWATRAGIGGDGIEVPLSYVAGTLSRRMLKLRCRQEGIDCAKDVAWI